MRWRRDGACPRCGTPLVLVDGSERTTRSGTFYEVRCTNCAFRMDGYRPRRSNRNK